MFARVLCQWSVTVVGLLMLVSSGGCKVAFSTGPMGLEPVSLKAEEWNGVWTVPGTAGHAVARVVDAEKGILEVGFIQSNDQGLSLKTMKLYLRQAGDWTFLSTEAQDRPGKFIWWKVKRSQNTLVMWPPRWDKLAALVKAGKLPGKQESDTVLVLDPLDKAQYELFTSEKEGVLVDWENPVVTVFAPSPQ
ncbi:MAG: hypothetical protein WHT09_07075 [Thermogutta sp.]